jgi:hypothetical protein
LKIDISTEKENFKKHLDLINNNQIIFSGIFGIGKTYFLKEFLIDNKEKYESILLSPVNYSISQTDDILEYIKYDIAFQLLGNGNVKFEKENFSTKLTSQFYIQDNFLDTLSLLAKNSDKIGKAFSDVYENLKIIINNIKEHNNEVQIDEKKELIDFLNEIVKKDKSIYEENRITQLISVLIETLKNNNKEVILVLDDVDRLDPEHIFRILNVFACHFDFGNYTENKFGLSKIILVCDIENIRSIFYAKYGQNVDFSGYIDKFYSREIYYYDNKHIVSSSIDKILATIKVPENYKHIIDFKQSNFTKVIFKEILEELVNNDLINLRTLLKIFDAEYLHISYEFKTDHEYGRASNWHYGMTLIFDMLLTYFGSKTSLQLALEKLAIKVPSISVNQRDLRKYGHLITLIDYKQHKSNEGDYLYTNRENNLTINYNIQHYGSWREQVTANINSINYLDGLLPNRLEFPFAPLIKIAFQQYISLGRIKN